MKYEYDWIPFNLIKEGHTAICDNMDKSWGQYTKWNTQSQKDKDCMIDSPDMKYLTWSNQPTKAETEWWLPVARRRGKWQVAIQQVWNFSYARWWIARNLLYNYLFVANTTVYIYRLKHLLRGETHLTFNHNTKTIDLVLCLCKNPQWLLFFFLMG